MSPDQVVTPVLDRPAPQVAPAQPHGTMNALLGADGRISMPGLPSGLSVDAYLPLVHLYASVLEASRVLDRYRNPLSQVAGDNPQVPLTPLNPSNEIRNLFYKREDLTITQAYKVRGAVVGMAKVMENYNPARFLAVSTGNHALGVLKAAELLRPASVRLVVPHNTAACKLEKISDRIHALQAQHLQAELVKVGETFDEAREWAMNQAEGEYYLDPYSDPWVVAGQGTVGLELFRQLKPLVMTRSVEEVVVIAPIGGGGLLAGTATALKVASAWDPRFRDVNLKLVGVRLSSLDTVYGDAIRVDQVASGNRMLFDYLGVSVHEIHDGHMAEGMQQVREDLGVYVEGASGATLYPALYLPEFSPRANRLVVCLLSGGNVNVVPEPRS